MSSFHFYGTAKYYVGYYQETWRNEKVQKFIIKGVADTKDAADKINKKLSEKLDKYSFHVGHTLCKHAGKKRPIKLQEAQERTNKNIHPLSSLQSNIKTYLFRDGWVTDKGLQEWTSIRI